MSTEVTTTTQPENPFARRELQSHVNAGAVSIESDRAVAEAQGKLILAKRFPRDEARAYANIIAACSRPQLAAVAIYAYPRGGQQISGPSIRLAEELARCWGNMSYGDRELSRREGVSEMEAFAWDEETNVKSIKQFTVRHIRDTRGGGVKLTDERDIYEITANMAGRRLRARILAILPPDIVEAAVEQCRKTVAGKADEPIGDRVRKMVAAFSKLGINADQIEGRLQHKLDETTLDDIVDLTGIFQSLKDGQSKPGDWFGALATAAATAAGEPTGPRALDKVKRKAAGAEPTPDAQAPDVAKPDALFDPDEDDRSPI